VQAGGVGAAGAQIAQDHPAAKAGAFEHIERAEGLGG
jgi:hypothetical protein